MQIDVGNGILRIFGRTSATASGAVGSKMHSIMDNNNDFFKHFRFPSAYSYIVN